jgi:hypothetical protein
MMMTRNEILEELHAARRKILADYNGTRRRTCVTHKPDSKRQADRSLIASSEQSDARERRSQANWQWRINRRRPVIGDARW